MNYIRQIARFIGVEASVAMTPCAGQAEPCANSAHNFRHWRLDA